ncbi:hypothetical protein EC973_008205 [Apophysomyces ossiformis]|uniref:Uncharacterized protein n=1 Tax=Apophysomyces ossiformis TaxID=679940 RepID=A0A8H7EPX7_9FUNG|nr:hypothetical protein EC973_008205 [Apophysomyces ossiformis]
MSASAYAIPSASVSPAKDAVKNLRKHVRHLVKDAQHGVVEKNPLLSGGMVYHPSQTSGDTGSGGDAAASPQSPLTYIDLVFQTINELFTGPNPQLKAIEDAINKLVAGKPFASFFGSVGAPIDMLLESTTKTAIQVVNGANELINNAVNGVVNITKAFVDSILRPFFQPSAEFQTGGGTSGGTTTSGGTSTVLSSGLRRRREVAVRLAAKGVKPFVKPIVKLGSKILQKFVNKAKKLASQERLEKLTNAGWKYSQKAKDLMTFVVAQATAGTPNFQPVLDTILNVSQRFISALLVQDPEILGLIWHPSLEGFQKAFEAVIRVLTQRI